MDSDLKQISKLILKERFSDFKSFYDDYALDLDLFKLKHKKILLKWFDEEDFAELKDYLYPEFLLIIYGKFLNKIYTVDWSGEEYPGQVKASLTKILKTYNKPTFKWNLKEFEATLSIESLKRGEYIDLLFKALDHRLSDTGFQLLFLDLFNDEYYYTILPVNEIAAALNIAGKDFRTCDSKTYDIEITSLGSNKSKIILFIKNKHKIELKEILKHIKNLPISVEKSCTILRIKELEQELKNLGCEYRITENTAAQ